MLCVSVPLGVDARPDRNALLLLCARMKVLSCCLAPRVILLATLGSQCCLGRAAKDLAFASPPWPTRTGRGQADALYASPAGSIPLLEKKYDGQAVEDYYSANPLPLIERLGRITPPVLSWYAGIKLDNITAPYIGAEAKAERTRRRARQLREALVSSGSVTFIKSGQALALRADLLKSPDYVRELEKLQDAVGTFPDSIAKRIISSELGVEAPEEIFEFVEEGPIASASIGQVYKARLRSTGELVAVKVQRPEALTSASVDMFILRRFAAFLKKWKKLRSDLVGLADEFGNQLFGELDYRQEARNCERFGALYGSIEGIFVPRVYHNLTTRRVLTQEWVEGEKGPWADGSRMLAVGLQCSVLQIFDSGFFHADPHRGNLLKTRDGNLAYIDFGMMADVSIEKRYALLATVFALQNRDLALLTENLVTLGFLPDTTELDVVIPALENAFRNASGGGEVVSSRVNFTRLNENIQNLSYLFPFRVPPFYSLIVRTLTILEGLALNVDPDFRIVKGAYPFIAGFLLESRDERTNINLRDLLKKVLITRDNRVDWKRLEQLLAISTAARSKDYSELKKAQDRSDIRKTFFQDVEEETPRMTVEFLVQVVNFLLSERGSFLKEALVNEMVDTIDAVQLASLGLASLLTGGWVPRPKDKDLQPDRGRLEAIWGVVVQLAEDRSQRGGGNGHGGLRAFALQVQQLLRQTGNQELDPLLRKVMPIVQEVIGRLTEKNARRLVKSGFGLWRQRPTAR